MQVEKFNLAVWTRVLFNPYQQNQKLEPSLNEFLKSNSVNEHEKWVNWMIWFSFSSQNFAPILLFHFPRPRRYRDPLTFSMRVKNKVGGTINLLGAMMLQHVVGKTQTDQLSLTEVQTIIDESISSTFNLNWTTICSISPSDGQPENWQEMKTGYNSEQKQLISVQMIPRMSNNESFCWLHHLSKIFCRFLIFF